MTGWMVYYKWGQGSLCPPHFLGTEPSTETKHACLLLPAPAALTALNICLMQELLLAN